MHTGGSGFRFYDSPNIKLNIWLVSLGLDVCLFLGPSALVVFFCSSVSVVLLTPKGSPGVSTRFDCRVLIFALSKSFH